MHSPVARLRAFAGRRKGPVATTVRWWLTYLWRSLMFRTTVIAITGSVGKTTTKECLAAILRAHASTHSTPNNQNDIIGAPRTVRAMRPWHRFAVIELGTTRPGEIRRLARLVRPHIAVILGVARTHTNNFPTLDDTAEEKAALLQHVSPHGVAVLNGDDPRVAVMAARSNARTVRFGSDAGCDYRAIGQESAWPDRLSFALEASSGRADVHTQLVGTHWTHCVLAALAAADSCGIPMREAIRRIGDVPPFMGRMQPVALPSGAIVVRDEETGTPDTLHAMIKVLSEAKARRRGLVFSDVSDTRAKPRKRMKEIGAMAAEHCELAVFVGGHAHHAVNAAVAGGMDPSSCVDFATLQDAAGWLQANLHEGDLVFLKGRTTDHLSRILFAQFGAIDCWKYSCSVRSMCDTCSRLQPEFDLEAALGRPLPGRISAVQVESRTDGAPGQ